MQVFKAIIKLSTLLSYTVHLKRTFSSKDAPLCISFSLATACSSWERELPWEAAPGLSQIKVYVNST